VTRAVVAQRLTERDLRGLSQPLGRGTVTLDRSGATLTPFEVIELEWPRRWAGRRPVRVLTVRDAPTTTSCSKWSTTSTARGPRARR
jgi:hypothetical protein